MLDGTHIAAAYLDLSTSTLHLASNGGCRAVVTTRDALGRSQVAVEVGRPTPTETAAAQDAAEAAAAARLRGQRQQQREQQRQPARKGAGLPASGGHLGDEGMASIRLTGDVESIVLGSPGLWCAVLLSARSISWRHSRPLVLFEVLCFMTYHQHLGF